MTATSPGELREVLALPPAVRRAALVAALGREAARAAQIPQAAPAARAEASLAAFGLDSLAAVELQQAIEGQLGVELPLAELLEIGSLGELAGLLLARLPAAPPGDNRAAAAVRQRQEQPAASLPLAPAQRQLWLFERLSPGTAVYHLAGGVRLSGRLSVAALGRSLAALVARHQALRTRLPAPDGEPVQVVEPLVARVLPLLDLGGLAEPRREAELARWVEAESRRPFDLERGPLLRLRLFRLASSHPAAASEAASRPDAGEHALLLVVHHLAADGWSLGVLAGELRALYEQQAAGLPPALPPLPMQYADYVRRLLQRDPAAAPARTSRARPSPGAADRPEPSRHEQDLAFWRRALAGAPPVLELPADRPRPARAGHRGATLPVVLAAELLASLDGCGRRHRATRFMTLAAAWAAALSRHAGADDLVLGVPVAVRHQPESRGLIGMFVNTLPLRLDLGGGPGFGALVEQVRERTLAALRHREVPPADNPLFQVMLALAGREQEGLSRLWSAPLAGLRTAPLAVDTGAAKLDLTLTLGPAVTERGLHGGLEYRRELFDRTTVERLWSHVSNLLAAALAAPESRLDELPLLSRAEAHQLLVESNATARGWPRGAGLHHLVEAQARRTPAATAVVWEGRRLSYRQLDQAAAKLAGELRLLGVGPETAVGVFLARTPLLVVALLAVLKAGGAYLPLDPAYPRERLECLLADSAAAVLLADATTSPLAPAGSAATLRLGEEILALPDAGGPQPPPAAAWAGPEQAAYVIYTSGSTGAPKAVVIPHAGAVALVAWAVDLYGSVRLAGVLAATSICFDLSVFEIFTPLACGGTVVLADSVLALPHLLAAGEVTLLNTVPSLMAELARGGAPLPPRLRTVNLAGEALSRELALRVLELPPVAELYNLYGPSEDSTYSTGCRVEPAAAPGIGRPLANRHALLLDRRLMPVPAGVTGELWLGGEGLARGYRNRPELTAERFRPNPFAGLLGPAGSRLYRSGDLARRRPGGEIDFLGRFDTQVKIRGVRIELGEVEAALARHPAVREAVAVAVDAASGEAGDRRLLACLVIDAAGSAAGGGAAAVPGAAPAPAPEPLARALRQALRGTLPDSMVPADFVVWDALPRTATGKVDRRALAARAPGRLPARRPYTAPRSDLERTLAALWAELLHVERVGIHDNFFELGGTSARGASLLARSAELFGVAPPLSELFAAPTVAALAAGVVHHLVEQADAAELAAAMDEVREP